MRRLFSITFIVLVIAVGVLKVAEWTSENWWMNSLGFGGAQMLFWKWRLGAFVPAFGLWWLVMGGNARLAWHNARWRDVSLPLLGPRAVSGRGHVTPEDRVRLDALAHRGSQGFVLLGALLCGVASANHFDLWVLARHPPTFGTADNASFLVGVWPALLWAWNAFGALLGFTLATVAAIAIYEGVLDFDSRGFRVGEATARHLAFCSSLLLLWIGVRCGLSALGEAVNFGWSPQGVSGFYERSFATPTRTFFLLSSPLLALWFGRAAPRRPLRPLLAAAGWSFGALFLPLIAPSFGRAVRANSASLNQTLRDENARHIAATRRAWGLDDVEERDLKVAAPDFSLPVSSTEAGSANPREIVAWPQEALRRALAQNDTDNGLGRVPGALFLSREGNTLRADVISSNPVVKEATSSVTFRTDPSRSGAVAVRRRPFEAVVMQSPFAPEFASPRAAPLPEGEAVSSPARVRETDSSGVVRENGFMGLALAVRFGNSSYFPAGRALTWHLDPLERMRTLAPFVWWTGARPHPVWTSVQGGSSQRLFWLAEGCFVSSSMPASAMLPAGDEWSGLSYARQSVLGVCDATTGETSFYLFDPNEPFSRVWNELLPGFFRPASELPAPIRSATRLSPALLNAQNFVWTRYHRALPGHDETLDWSKRSDEWRLPSLDTSDRNTLTHPTLVKRGGKVGLEQLAAFAPWGGTPASNNTNAPDGTALVALLSARDEGEDIWRERGRARFSSWRAAKPIALPLSGEATFPPVVSSFAFELFEKRALFLSLDERGDCTGLGISHGQAKRVKLGRDAGKWFLETKVASTTMELAPTSSPAKSGENLKQARNLWSAWKSARADGQWARVEELERALNRLLTP